MKKLIQISSALIISSSAGLVLSSNLNYVELSTKETTNLQWNDIKVGTLNYFSNIPKEQFKNNSLKSNDYTAIKNNDFEKSLVVAQKKSMEYIERFQKENFSYEQIINTLSTEIPQFAKEYNNSLNNLQISQKNSLVISQTAYQLQNISFSNVDATAKKLRISYTALTTASAVAAVAAAGFWAAAFWSFGGTVPWAVGCSMASAFIGAGAAGISIALTKYDQELSGWQKVGMTSPAIIKLGHIFYSVLNPILITATASISTVTWAFPAAFAALGVIGTILALIQQFK